MPDSVVLVGASGTPGSIGNVLLSNLMGAGFGGEIFLVNPTRSEVLDHKCYPDIESLPEVPDLAVIATPPETVPAILLSLAIHGTRAAVIITAGFGDVGDGAGQRWKEEILEIAHTHLIRIAGPNCIGIMVPGQEINASFCHISPLPGNLAFVAQSGAILTSVVDWATSKNIGFSHIVSLGDMVDVDFGDMLNYLVFDGGTRAILLYIESISHARKFMSAARAAARLKPVIVVKAGRFTESAKAAASHTGALAGIDAVYDAAFRRSGVLRVMDMEALFNAVETLALAGPLKGNRLAVLTNGGGVGVLAVDTLIEKRGRLAELSSETIEQLDKVLPANWSRTNPVDIIGDADGVRYEQAMSCLLGDAAVDGLLVMNCPTAVASGYECAEAVVRAAEKRTANWRKPMILTNWLGGDSTREARELFRDRRIPSYQTPDDAVRGFMQKVRYQHSQELLMETVPDTECIVSGDSARLKERIERVMDLNREWLNVDEVRDILSTYGIPMVSSFTAKTVFGAGRIAATIDGPVALKVLSPDITHKSDRGGVILGLNGAESVQAAAEDMKFQIRELSPEAEIEGFIVQPMVRRESALELIIGMFDDQQFGPVLLFGHGGTAVEVIRDKALTLPPLNMKLAREVMMQTRVYKLLKGYRNTPAADLDSIALTLVKVSRLVCELGDVAELDINPLLADANGIIALDARIRVARSEGDAADRLAIRPYPRELEEQLLLPDGQRLLLRPIRPEDEMRLQELFSALTPEDIRMRFLHPMSCLSHDLAARMTQIDYDREMALVLDQQGDQDRGKLLGKARIIADPDNEEAEFAIMLRREATGAGLGPMLMSRIIEYARGRGIGRLYGDVLVENRPMLRLAEAFGFLVQSVPEDPAIRQVNLYL